MRRLTRALARFARDTRASFSIEMVLILPLLFWTVAATYGFVDAYRMRALNLRATYTIGDLLSRQWNPVNIAFLDGMESLHNYLTNGRSRTGLRVTVVTWDPLLSRYQLVWSHATGLSLPVLTQTSLSEITPHLPNIAPGDTLIYVQTWMEHTPLLNIGLGPQTFENETVVSPRFVPQLKLADALL